MALTEIQLILGISLVGFFFFLHAIQFPFQNSRSKVDVKEN